jgi:hypothetical protein
MSAADDLRLTYRLSNRAVVAQGLNEWPSWWIFQE